MSNALEGLEQAATTTIPVHPWGNRPQGRTILECTGFAKRGWIETAVTSITGCLRRWGSWGPPGATRSPPSSSARAPRSSPRCPSNILILLLLLLTLCPLPFTLYSLLLTRYSLLQLWLRLWLWLWLLLFNWTLSRNSYHLLFTIYNSLFTLSASIITIHSLLCTVYYY